MKLFSFELGRLSANCYIVVSEKNNAVMIDCPGDADVLLKTIEDNKLNLKNVILTHGHFDHIDAVSEIKAATGADVLILRLDEPMLSDPVKNLSMPFGMPIRSTKADANIDEGDEIAIDELRFKVMHTPGHSPGSVCLLLNDIIFTGDTLFKGSVGRWDFEGSDYQDEISSLERLMTLDDLTVLSGHGDPTSINHEKNHNYFIKDI